MKSSLVLGLALVLVAAFCLVAVADAAKEVTVKGTVAVAKDGDDNVTGITIKDEKDEYQVKLDDNGKKVAGENGNTVEAKGTVEEKDGKKTLTVTSFKKVEKPAETK